MHRIAAIAASTLATAVLAVPVAGAAPAPRGRSGSTEAAIGTTAPTAPRTPQAPPDGPSVTADPPLPIDRPGPPVPVVDGVTPPATPGTVPPVGDLIPRAPSSPPSSAPARAEPAGATPTSTVARAQAAAGHPFPGLPAGAMAAYSTGTVLHAATVEAAGTSLRDLNLANSSAAFGSAAVPARVNELGRPVAPALGAGGAFAKGRAVDLAAEPGSPAAASPALRTEAQAQAPPTSTALTGEPGRVSLDPVMASDLLHSQAQAKVPVTGCLVGSDLASSAGYVGTVDLADLDGDPSRFGAPLISLGAPGRQQTVSQSVSFTRLVRSGPGGAYGLLAETRQTVAPVTFLPGTERQFTVEVLGEWALRAVADGKRGAVTFGPVADRPETPVLRVTGPDGGILEEVSLARLLGQRGLVVDIGEFAEIAVGEDPRAIGGDAASAATQTPRVASGAADIVRVRLVDTPDYRLGTFRLGHMETAAAVPETGVICPDLALTHETEPPLVRPGERFTWKIAVTNPNDCTLPAVQVVDTLTAPAGVRFAVKRSEPAAQVAGTTVTWPDVGALGPGKTTTLVLDVEVAGDSRGGRFTPEAVATGACVTDVGGADLLGGLTAAVPGGESIGRMVAPLRRLLSLAPPAAFAQQGRGGAREPEVVLPLAAAKAPAPGGLTGMLARTGGLYGVLPALTLIGTGLGLRRLRRRG